MNEINIMNIPLNVSVELESKWIKLTNKNVMFWEHEDVQIKIENGEISLQSPSQNVKRIVIRWRGEFGKPVQILNDHWERGYGDLEWRGIVPERILPWFFMVTDKDRTDGYGVKTGANAMCFWQVDGSGVKLCLDVRNGTKGVKLNDRTLDVATVVYQKGQIGENAFTSMRKFCKKMCDKPCLPHNHIYGSNNWYYAYGKSSQLEIIEDSKFISDIASENKNRPFMVIDDGWQTCHDGEYNGGPWNKGNYLFPDMANMAHQMRAEGVKPGIWFRPLLTREKFPENLHLNLDRFSDVEKLKQTGNSFLDPSSDYALEKIKNDIIQIKEWGFDLIKHDFTTFDIFGAWGFDMGSSLTCGEWGFYDETKTTAEIIKNMYTTIKKASGSMSIIGCNTIGHLSAGIFDIQRTGDDTSGREWERTRKMGINTLAYTLPKHDTFFAIDADCVGITDNIPWELNKQWLYLLANSGTPLFASIDKNCLNNEQIKDIKEAFKVASNPIELAEPIDFTETTTPRKWKIDDKIVEFNWDSE